MVYLKYIFGTKYLVTVLILLDLLSQLLHLSHHVIYFRPYFCHLSFDVGVLDLRDVSLGMPEVTLIPHTLIADQHLVQCTVVRDLFMRMSLAQHRERLFSLLLQDLNEGLVVNEGLRRQIGLRLHKL